MIALLSGIFLILHGIVFYLYAGQSARLFELKPGMIWPDESWAFSKILDHKKTRMLSLILCLLSGTGLIISGIAVLSSAAWWYQMFIASTAFSSIIIILLWNGSLQKLSDQGFIGLLINVVLLAVL